MARFVPVVTSQNLQLGMVELDLTQEALDLGTNTRKTIASGGTFEVLSIALNAYVVKAEAFISSAFTGTAALQFKIGSTVLGTLADGASPNAAQALSIGYMQGGKITVTVTPGLTPASVGKVLLAVVFGERNRATEVHG